MKKTDRLISVFSGHDVKKFFSNEIGGHRFQRIPPTESKGRTHTSTVSVTVLDEKQDVVIKIDPNDVEVIYTRGTGNGGQHKNTTDSCVILRHISGVQVRIDGRNQHHNESEAWKELKRRLTEIERNKKNSEYSSKRKEQIGLGGRGEKRRTYNVKTGLVKDHITGKQTSLKKVLKGKIELLH
ncbi:MAG: PCRF domain-containing protein [Ignavibacteria bacterium]|nr:PCRF domain-containing protein [Ignavibacteria bacterium]